MRREGVKNSLLVPTVFVFPLCDKNALAIKEQYMMNQALTEARPEYLVGAPRSEILLNIAALLMIGASVLILIHDIHQL